MSEATQEAERELRDAEKDLLRAAFRYGDVAGNGEDGRAALARELRSAAVVYARAVVVHEQEAEADINTYVEEDVPW